MAREPSSIDLLHEALFGFVPGNPGTAYERLTAIVLAGLGWTGVKQQASEQPEGARAKQTLDVVARHPSGEQRRLIVQCKHYAETVGKEVIDTLVGIFAIEQRPTGTRDPFALRRAALGVLRILLEKDLELDLVKVLALAADAQPVSRPAAAD